MKTIVSFAAFVCANLIKAAVPCFVCTCIQGVDYLIKAVVPSMCSCSLTRAVALLHLLMHVFLSSMAAAHAGISFLNGGGVWLRSAGSAQFGTNSLQSYVYMSVCVGFTNPYKNTVARLRPINNKFCTRQKAA